MSFTSLSLTIVFILSYIYAAVDAEYCEDISGKFNVNSNEYEITRTCKQVRRRYPHLCIINDIVKANCPLSCGECGPYGNHPICVDSNSTFYMGQYEKGCKNAAKNSNLCQKQMVAKNCPRTCGLCTPTFTNCPVDGNCCNGLETNCYLRVDEMLFATLHNANHNSQYVTFSNHKAPLEEALEAGYRAFFLDVCKCNNDDDSDLEVVFCHSYCGVGRRDPVTVFTNIVSWLENNPTELIIFNFEVSKGYPYPSEIWSLMKSISGIQSRTYVHSGGQWPTMGSLLSSGYQIIAFYHNGPQCPNNTGCTSYIQEFFDYTMETDYAFEDVEAVETLPESCTPTRGRYSTKDFYSINNFVTSKFGPSYSAAKELNELTFVEQRLYDCHKITGAMPNFINIDYWQQGDVPRATQEVNAFRGRGYAQSG